MEINLIGVPIQYGCDKDGPQQGPGRLRELGIVEALESEVNKVYDMGNIFVPAILPDLKYKWHEKMKYLNPVVEINKNLAHMVYCSLAANCFPFVLGGDHSLGMGSIAGGSRFFNEMAVVWVDAHGDINDSETSPTGNIHGMPLAASLGIGHPSITNIYFEGNKVKPENVYILGARDLDPGEIKLAKDLNINLYTMDYINSNSLEKAVNDILLKLKNSNVDGIHLSFDIDVLDSAIVPGTGTPVKDGISFNEGKYILNELLKSKLITSMDLVELNPVLDQDAKTEILCMDILKFVGELLKKY